MAYKTKGYKGSGGYKPKSGYLRPSDPMERYKRQSAPETEYDRKVRNFVSKTEMSGPSPVSLNYHRYHTNRPQVEHVPEISKKEVQDLINDSLKDAFKKFVEEKNIEKVPDEAVLVAYDAVDAAVKRMTEPRQEEATEQLVDVGSLNEMRQERVNEKWKEANHAETLIDAEKAMSEIREMNSEFFGNLDNMEKDRYDEPTQRREVESDLRDVNPLLEGAGLKKPPVEAHDFAPTADFIPDERLETKKRNRLDYDSELGW